jgi:hypothetical protein
MPVESLEFGVSSYGCYNMAGNVSEWGLNETSEGYITSGGSWEDPPYVFGYYGRYPGFYSSDKLGFRCVRNLPDATGNQGAMRIQLEEEVPTYTPASEARVKAWFKYYDYDKTPLDPQIVDVKEADQWRRERITYTGAGGERAIAYLYLPKNFQRPLSVIHLMPAADVGGRFRSLPESIEMQVPSLIRSGRALFSVVLKGYIERDRPANYRAPSPDTIEFLEESVNQIVDLRRGLDYLETRKDIDAGKIAYFAPSSGGYKHILPAIETRYRCIVLMGAAVRQYYRQWRPEANPINFIPHIRAPKLMLHGRYDEAAPWKMQGEPLYKLLREPKQLILFESGHIPPLELMVPAINDWLDKTLGPVKRE